jgi:hypothetical protein
MTVLNIVEQVREQFPSLSRTWIVFNLNTELQRFSKQTNCNLAVTDYDVTDFTRTLYNDSYIYTLTIPGAIYKILDIDGLRHNEFGVVGDELRLYAIPSNIDTITITYCILPTAVTSDSTELTIPSEFHEGILYKLLSTYYTVNKNLQMAGWYLQQYHAFVLDARRYVNERDHISKYTASEAAAVATKMAYGQQAVTAGENTITMSITFSNTTYAVSLNYGNIMAAETDPKVRTVNTFKIDSASDNPTFEYIAVGI